MVYPWMLNDRFNAAFPNYRGVSLPTPTPTLPPIPAPPPIPEPPPVATPSAPPTLAEPYRDVPAGATEAWRAGVDHDTRAGLNNIPATPTVGPRAVAPVPYVTPTNVPGQQGVTIDSNPLTPAGPVQPSSDVNSPYQKALAGLDEIAKGVKPKSSDRDSGLNTLTPISSYGGNSGGGAGQGAQLLAALLANARRNYGTKMTGY